MEESILLVGSTQISQRRDNEMTSERSARVVSLQTDSILP